MLKNTGGRYVRNTSLQTSAKPLSAIGPLPELGASLHIAPSPPMPMVQVGAGGRRELALGRWGWCRIEPNRWKPGAWDDQCPSETVNPKPAFRDALKYSGVAWCRPTVSWRGIAALGHVNFITLTGAVSNRAGWPGCGSMGRTRTATSWKPGGILTIQATNPVSKIHHRIPGLLTHDQVPDWLNPRSPTKALLDLLYQGTSDKDATLALAMHPVTPQVNHALFKEPVNIVPAKKSTSAAMHSFLKGTLFDWAG